MAKLTHAEHSKISKRTWKSRKPKHTCAYCHKGIWVRGIQEGNRWYHRVCWNRMQVAKIREKTATRGFYAK